LTSGKVYISTEDVAYKLPENVLKLTKKSNWGTIKHGVSKDQL
jgi:hypothetical protein